MQVVVAKLLAENSDSNTLKDAWDELTGEDKPLWDPNAITQFSHALTRYLLRDNANSLANFTAVLNNIRPKVKQDNAKEIFEYVRSLWVDAKSAGCIPQSKTHQKFLAQNGNQLPNFTFERYAERAWPMDNNYKIVSTSSSEESKLLEQIRAEFKQSQRIALTPEQCDARINDYRRQIVIYIPAKTQDGGGLLDDPLLRTSLRQKFPKAIFVLGTGEQLPEVVADDVAKVEPSLDVQIEFAQMIAEGDTEDFLKDFYAN